VGLIFEWDDEKAFTNQRKHGITFEEATTAFKDVLSITIDDPQHSQEEEEDRLILIGKSESDNTLVVIHIEKRDTIRIISARKATKKRTKIL